MVVTRWPCASTYSKKESIATCHLYDKDLRTHGAVVTYLDFSSCHTHMHLLWGVVGKRMVSINFFIFIITTDRVNCKAPFPSMCWEKNQMMYPQQNLPNKASWRIRSSICIRISWLSYFKNKQRISWLLGFQASKNQTACPEISQLLLHLVDREKISFTAHNTTIW